MSELEGPVLPAIDSATPEATEPLPDVFQSDLDGALFESLMDDLEQHAELLEVRLKQGPEVHAEETTVTLEKARMLLVLGRVHAVRIQYRHEGIEWVDTVLGTKTGMRIVRMRIPDAMRTPERAPDPDANKRRLPLLL